MVAAGFLALYRQYGPNMQMPWTLFTQMYSFAEDHSTDLNRQLGCLLWPGENICDVLAATDNNNCLEMHIFLAALMDKLHLQLLNKRGFWGMYGTPPPACMPAEPCSGILFTGVPGEWQICLRGLCETRFSTSQSTSTSNNKSAFSTQECYLILRAQSCNGRISFIISAGSNGESLMHKGMPERVPWWVGSAEKCPVSS